MNAAPLARDFYAKHWLQGLRNCAATELSQAQVGSSWFAKFLTNRTYMSIYPTYFNRVRQLVISYEF